MAELQRSFTAPPARSKSKPELDPEFDPSDLRSLLEGLPFAPEAVFAHDAPQESFDTYDWEQVSTDGSQIEGAVQEESPKALSAADVTKRAAKSVMMRDKLSFVIGIVLVFGTGLWLGYSPSTLYIPYAWLVVILLGGRYIVYRRSKQQYYMLDFCYIANFISMAVLWLVPALKGSSVSPTVFKVLFAFNEGPLMWSIPAMRNSLVLHSFDKLTTLFIHIGPAMVSYTLHWFPECFLQKCGNDGVSAEYREASFYELAVLPLIPYTLWIIGYYVILFVINKGRIQRRGYHTVYEYWMQSRHPIAAALRTLPEGLQPIGYLGCHFILCCIAMALTYVWWHSWAAHTAILSFFALLSIWNGATFYFDVFAHRYIRSLGIPLKPLKRS